MTTLNLEDVLRDDALVRRLAEEDLRRRAARACVRELRGTPWLVYAVTTGACGELVPMLWQPAGASQNVLGDRFTYAQEETVEFLGFEPEKSVSVDVSRFLATAAYFQGRKLAARRGKNENHVMGVGMTAAVTTDRERRGEDRVVIAVRTLHGLFTVDALLRKPADFVRDAEEHRVEQGNLADLLVLDAILAAAGVSQVRLPSERIERCGELTSDGILAPEPARFWDDDDRPVYGKVVMPDGALVDPADLDPARWILFPGSFNPVTYAHDEMARAIELSTGKRVLFQITRSHPNKVVTDRDMVSRAEQLRYRWPVVLLEGAGLYVEKARLFPGMEMLVGADAVLEMLQERHYGGFPGLQAALDEMLRLGTGFHVNGRMCGDGTYREVDLLPVPGRYAGMFHPFSRRMDVSSSDRRAAGATV